MELNRFQMAAVKRTLQNTKKLVREREKVINELASCKKTLEEIDEMIKVWEEPIRLMTGGYSAEDVMSLNGILPDLENDNNNIEVNE